MAEPARKPMTADEFLDWDDGTDTRHELVDGLVLAMAPTTDAHGTIAVNAALEINGRLDGRPPCRAIAEAGIRLDDGNHYEADVAATCAEPRGGRYVEEPFLIVEVLSGIDGGPRPRGDTATLPSCLAGNVVGISALGRRA
jgi:Uma2 family endonuclease